MCTSTKSFCLLLAILSLLFTIVQSSCNDAFRDLMTWQGRGNNTNCKKLSALGAEFGWNIRQNRSTIIDVLFGVRQHNDIRWIAWGVNPGNSPEMVGTRAIIGVIQKNGTVVVNTYNITSNTKLGCQLFPSTIEFPVENMKGASTTSGYITISGTLFLDTKFYNVEKLNHVWQVGYDADQESLEPKMHPPTLQNFDSTETLNLTSGVGHGVGHHRRHLRMIHGILNMIGWGTLLPAGVILARYFRKFPVDWKNWYFCHVGCQILGYVLGTAGWAVGLWLGHASIHYSFKTHRLLAIFIFTFTTLQMLALRLRPEPHDNYRKYWDMYHHFLGYALLAVIAINMFRGIAILKPDHTWKWAYIGVLGALAAVTLALEIFTWTKFLKSYKTKDKNKNPQTNTSANTHNK
ncbi:Cytochrome b561 and DOMON domain-containing protein [Parasponia andersonii]|uniref:Cytochrome b561 and DOMON domain-containing protein n=1 Tax=Parasponia andersonii TaxID=3476 RepID=A0A2P5AXB4_PARAD|nr:Cytochrome b561 and DOMON domain-containing protein [Parasponia andersonii]